MCVSCYQPHAASVLGGGRPKPNQSRSPTPLFCHITSSGSLDVNLCSLEVMAVVALCAMTGCRREKGADQLALSKGSQQREIGSASVPAMLRLQLDAKKPMMRMLQLLRS